MKESFNTYLIDILSILLPGALLMAVLAQVPGLPALFGSVFGESKTEWVNGAIYVGTAYTLGHFVFFAASHLDGWLFEPVKKRIWRDDTLVNQIIAMKDKITGIRDAKVLNAFKWSTGWLLNNNPALYHAVERHVAESKFFRSAGVVFVIGGIILMLDTGAGRDASILAGIFLFLAILSMIRYISQRQKSIEMAYQLVLIATTSPKTA